MKNGLVELVVILDKSGSMGGLEGDVIGGFNSLIEQQGKNEGEVNVTTIVFDNDVSYINKRTNIKEIKKMTNKDYIPSGCTALLDAIGSGVAFINSHIMTLSEEEKPEHVIFSIMTDGYENASREYNYKQIKNMIENQKKEGWDFIFQAANIDVAEEGAKLGIAADDMIQFNCSTEGVRYCFENACAKVSNKISKKNK